MKKILLLAGVLLSLTGFTQRHLITSPSGGNKKAGVTERIGITDVTIHYDRPTVKGREGKIWGGTVQGGFFDQQFGTSKAAPWRAGANESTTIEFSTDVKVEGQDLAAGKYGFFIAYGPDECTLIFSRNTTAWGSFYYNDKEDVLRVKVKPVALDRSVEWLKYEFTNETENAATVNLMWEKLDIPFRVEVDLNKTQVASFRRELQTDIGFFWLAWQTAAQWCVDHNTNLEEALLWADTSTNPNILGQRNFQSLSTKAQVLAKLGRDKEAEDVMKDALPMATMAEVHAYGRQLLAQKKGKQALDVFRMNYDKHPTEFTTIMGMARGYSAVGDYKNSLEFLQKAQPLSPNAVNTQNITRMMDLLKQGKDIN